MTAPRLCLTCNGTGEAASEHGPATCADCFGEGRMLDAGVRIEWRLRELERAHRGTEREVTADIVWLVHEVRRARGALLRIFARCYDAPESDETARAIRFEANEALGLFDLESTRETNRR